ncbi:MAG: ArsB/NhaD family transporter [Bacillota bacterium]|nr:ArsB/NhaD family transporter [Bacillota bacterium]
MTAEGPVLLGAGIFVAVYGLIVTEKIHRSAAALAGGMAVLASGLLTQAEAVRAIDFNTIGLLVGMMIIVGVTRRSGVFEFLAVLAARLARGEPFRILAGLAVLTAVASAFLDNVTTVLLVVPVTFSIVYELNLNPVPFVVAEILASNIGGTATLIGDPPNIMIGSATKLTFLDFLVTLAPVAVVIFLITLFFLWLIYRRNLEIEDHLKEKVKTFDAVAQIKDYRLMRRSLAVLGLTILGFFLHGALHLETASIALGGAVLLLFITREEIEDVLLSVEWPTIFFFMGLFIIVGALEKVGIIEELARAALDLTKGRVLATGTLILWFSAIASSVVDNIPFVAAMIPLIKEMGHFGGILNLDPLWWSLALGACLGGNGTLIGAAANVIVAGLAERNGVTLSFVKFFKVAFPLMLLSVAIAQVYLLIFYFR